MPGETDLIIYFGPIVADKPSWYQPGYRLVSLENQFKGNRHFYQEGINFIVPQLDPIVIPPLTYQLPGNEGPIHTLSVDTLLVTRKDVPEKLIYEMARTLIAFARWRAHRKKDRIDTFYTRVFSIRERAGGEDLKQLQQELYVLEREAFESLIAEKLAADESFRIFTELLSNTRATLDAGQPASTSKANVQAVPEGSSR